MTRGMVYRGLAPVAFVIPLRPVETAYIVIRRASRAGLFAACPAGVSQATVSLSVTVANSLFRQTWEKPHVRLGAISGCPVSI